MWITTHLDYLHRHKKKICTSAISRRSEFHSTVCAEIRKILKSRHSSTKDDREARVRKNLFRSTPSIPSKPSALLRGNFRISRFRNLTDKIFRRKKKKKSFDAITEKVCLCVGLTNAALIVNRIETNGDGAGVSICPGPNIAYFDRAVSLKEMVDHIYGRIKLVNESHRPNMFVKELRLYVDYLKTKISESAETVHGKTIELLRLVSKKSGRRN